MEDNKYQDNQEASTSNAVINEASNDFASESGLNCSTYQNAGLNDLLNANNAIGQQTVQPDNTVEIFNENSHMLLDVNHSLEAAASEEGNNDTSGLILESKIGDGKEVSFGGLNELGTDSGILTQKDSTFLNVNEKNDYKAEVIDYAIQNKSTAGLQESQHDMVSSKMADPKTCQLELAQSMVHQVEKAQPISLQPKLAQSLACVPGTAQSIDYQPELTQPSVGQMVATQLPADQSVVAQPILHQLNVSQQQVVQLELEVAASKRQDPNVPCLGSTKNRDENTDNNNKCERNADTEQISKSNSIKSKNAIEKEKSKRSHFDRDAGCEQDISNSKKTKTFTN